MCMAERDEVMRWSVDEKTCTEDVTHDLRNFEEFACPPPVDWRPAA